MNWNYVYIGIAFLAAYLIINYMSIRKNKKYFEKLHTSLKIGQEVIFSGGIYGKVVDLDNETARVQINKDTTIKISRYAISKIVNK